MIKKLAIATLAITALVVAVGLAGNRQQAPADLAADPADAAAQTLEPAVGLKPLPEVVELWRTKVDGQPLDYLNRTRLGTSLNALAAETADLEHYAEAEAVFNEALAANPRHGPARLGLASSLIAQHEFAAARAELELADEAGAPPLPTLALVGDANLGIGRYDDAAAAYEALVDGERSAPTVSRLARLRWYQGRPAEAVTLAEEALALSTELSLRPSGRAFYHFQLGHFLFAAGDVEPAIDQYRLALDEAPGHPGASEALPFALAASGQLDEAATRYVALADEAGAADLYGLAAEVLAATGDEAGAAAQEELGLAAAAETLDGHPAERRHIAQFLTTRDPELAVQLATDDLAERADVGAYDTLAWALHHAGRSDEAVAAIESALAFDTQDAAVFYHAAAIHAEAGDTAAAVGHLEAALAVNPHFHPTEAAAAAALADELGVA